MWLKELDTLAQAYEQELKQDYPSIPTQQSNKVSA
jgi:hypothetical protein